MLVVLLLSIVTVEYCQKDKVRFTTDSQRLFLGVNAVHSFASNLGSLFSVTYFFGATVIYGRVFGGWLFCIALASMFFSWLIIRAFLLAANDKGWEPKHQEGNLLLNIFRSALDKSDLKIVLGIYLVEITSAW